MKLPDRNPIKYQSATLDAGDVSLFFPRHEWPKTGIFAMSLKEFREVTKTTERGDYFKRDLEAMRKKIEAGESLRKTAHEYGIRPQDLARYLKEKI